MNGLVSIGLSGGTTRSALGASAREEDLYAKWRDIFDQPPPSLAHEPRRQAGAACDLRDEYGSTGAGERTSHTPTAAGQGSTQPLSTGTLDNRRTSSRLEGLQAKVAAELLPPVSPGSAAATVRLSASTMPSERSTSTSVAAADLARLQPAMPAAQRTAAPTEAVSVFVKGTAVAVVVRNAALAEQDALRSAFATARELTGSSAGLQQLTVNGRVLYRHLGAAGAFDAPAGPLQFAC